MTSFDPKRDQLGTSSAESSDNGLCSASARLSGEHSTSEPGSVVGLPNKLTPAAPALRTETSSIGLTAGQKVCPRRHHIDKRAADLAEKAAGNPDDLLCTKQLARWLGCSVEWLEIGRSRGYGPPFIRLGRPVRYRRGDVLQWLTERRYASSSEYKTAGGRPQKPESTNAAA